MEINEAHSDFVYINGINREMNIYEQIIMEIYEEHTTIVVQHNGIKGAIRMVFNIV